MEVYKDVNDRKVVLDDWRLPTEAELKIIMKFQGGPGEEADAIDYLLNAYYYFSASGPVRNEKAIRVALLSAASVMPLIPRNREE